VVGLALGLVGSIGAGGLMAAAFPSERDQRDLMALALVAPVVLVVTFLATYIPARRASRMNPTEALRYQ
jgi:putative ABC transport system permease protein